MPSQPNKKHRIAKSNSNSYATAQTTTVLVNARVCKHVLVYTIRVYMHGDVCKRTYMITTHELSIQYVEIQSYRLPTSKYQKWKLIIYLWFPTSVSTERICSKIQSEWSENFNKGTHTRFRFFSSLLECTRWKNKQRFDINNSFVFILIFSIDRENSVAYKRPRLIVYNRCVDSIKILVYVPVRR